MSESNAFPDRTRAEGGGFGQIDYRALSEATVPEQLREYKNLVRKSPGFVSKPSRFGGSVSIVFSVIIAVIVGLVFLGIAQFFVSMFAAVTGASGLGYLLPVLLLGGGAVWATRTVIASRTKWLTWFRLDQFARRNGFAFVPTAGEPGYPGAIFNRGRDRTSTSHLLATNGRFFDIGNYEYTTGSGKESTTHRWGFLAVKLDRRLPNMMLDAKANNGFFGGSNLPAHFRRDQVLRLEGDFNNYFTLYAPTEYERDALYIFTPDLMALLIDKAAAFDVEVVDDWLFVYSSTPLEASDEMMWRRMFEIIQTVGAKTLGQSENYRDDRAVPAGTPPVNAFVASENRVAPQGHRLRKGVNWTSIAIGVAMVIAWAIFAFSR